MPGLARYSRPFITPSYGYYNCDCEPVNGYLSTSLSMTLTGIGGNANVDSFGYAVTLSGSLSGPGGLNKAGPGTLTLTTSNTYTGGTTVSAGTLQLGDGIANNGYVKGNILNNAAVTFANPAPQTYSGVISGAGSLAKLGSGTLLLSGNNTYAGPTIINLGALEVDGSLTSAVTVNAGGVLAGTGTVGPITLSSGGQLSPGSASTSGSSGVGTLTLGSLSMMGSSVLDFDLGPAGVVGQGANDLLVAHGNVNFNGILNLNPLPNFGAGTYTLVLYDGAVTYNGLQLSDSQPFICPSQTVTDSPMFSTVLGSGTYDYQLEFTPSSRDNPGAMNLIVSAIPEPQTLLLLLPVLVTFAGLSWLRHWRSKEKRCGGTHSATKPQAQHDASSESTEEQDHRSRNLSRRRAA